MRSTLAYFFTNLVSLFYKITYFRWGEKIKANINKITGSLNNKYFVLMFYSITMSRIILRIS